MSFLLFSLAILVSKLRILGFLTEFLLKYTTANHFIYTIEINANEKPFDY